ncbi:MAG TPA: M50 family metallopeptidase [Candidatus Dormibacteraeota bacterium]|nr:M50 family metallopeptidase [Candidatus Dormibacteraeota bacterium]
MLLAIVTLDGTLKVVTFLVMLSVLVVLHELGHFILARRNGVRVNEFAVGMGPKIFGWKSPRTGTQYSVRALLIGGYCAMHGEDAKTSEAAQQREFQQEREEHVQPLDADNFQAKSPWQRLSIIVAGPLANFILAYVILLLGAFAFGVESPSSAQAVVGQVVPHSPAALHGLRPGDRIVALDGRPVTNGDALVTAINGSLGRRVTLDYVRNGARYEFDATPVRCASLEPVRAQEREKGCIGFSPFPAFARVGFGEAFVVSAKEYGDIASNVFGSIALLATDFPKYSSQVTGVVGMGQAATTIQSFGWGPYLALAATISFALGVFNLLPIPALDGGRGAFIVAELIRRKPVDPEREGMVHLAGFAVLLVLMLVIALHDIMRIVAGQGAF